MALSRFFGSTKARIVTHFRFQRVSHIKTQTDHDSLPGFVTNLRKKLADDDMEKIHIGKWIGKEEHHGYVYGDERNKMMTHFLEDYALRSPIHVNYINYLKERLTRDFGYDDPDDEDDFTEKESGSKRPRFDLKEMIERLKTVLLQDLTLKKFGSQAPITSAGGRFGLMLKETKKTAENELERLDRIRGSSVWVPQFFPMPIYDKEMKILLVGEGDFSFARSLAIRLGCAKNITATSLDSMNYIQKTFKHGPANIAQIIVHGGRVLFNIDATDIRTNKTVGTVLYDRIIFNHPHCGIVGDERSDKCIKLNQKLVNLFLLNARAMIMPIVGEVHVIHNRNTPYKLWKLEKLGWLRGFTVVEMKWFPPKLMKEMFPYYENKKGKGRWPDDTFNADLAVLYIFKDEEF